METPQILLQKAKLGQIRYLLANLPDELCLFLVGLPLSGNIHHFIPHNWEFRLFQLVDFWELCHHLICGGLCLGLLHQSRRHHPGMEALLAATLEDHSLYLPLPHL